MKNVPEPPHPIRLGLVGCGRATGSLHLPQLRRGGDFRVTALADFDRVRLDAVGDQFGIDRRCATVEEMLEDEALEAIAICTPVGAHLEPALAALAAGRHVLVEKPLALTMRDGERLVEAAAGSDCVAAVGFQLRCHRLVRRARALVAEGRLGRVHQIVTTWCSPSQHDPAMPEWRRRRQTGGGVFFELGIHHLDLIAFLLEDPIAEVRLQTREGTCEDESVSLLGRTRGGVLMTSVFSQVTAPVHTIQILGDAGWLHFSLFGGASFTLHCCDDPHYGLASKLHQLKRIAELPAAFRAARAGGDWNASYGEEWRAMARAIRTGGRPPATFEDGLTALRLLHGAFVAGENL